MAVVLAGLLTLMPGPAGAAPPRIVTECGVPVRLADGEVLSANIRRPANGRVPTVLTVTGYNKDNFQHFPACAALGGSLPADGYAVMVIDEPGTGGSTGAWDMWGGATQRAHEQILDWIQAQAWSDGAVGTTGGSYMGITSLHVAAADARRVRSGQPRAVRAVWADQPMGDLYRDVGYHGGNPDAFYQVFVGSASVQNSVPYGGVPRDPAVAPWIYAAHLANVATFGAPTLSDTVTAGDTAYDGPFYRLRSPAEHIGMIDVPLAAVGGWYDIFQRGQTQLFRLADNAPRRAFFIGPQYHASIPSDVFKKLGVDGVGDVRKRWWDRWLKRIDNGVERIPELNLYTMGAGRWRHESAWPPARTRWQRLYLHAGPSGSARSLNDGVLTAARTAGNGSDVAPVLPTAGICNRATAQWTAGAAAGTPCDDDNSLAETTGLTYTTAPLAHELEITGPISATLFARLSRSDGTLVATVSDVSPDGRSKQISAGWLNASHRAVDPARSLLTADGDHAVPFHPFTRAAQAAVTPGAVERYDIEVFPTSYALAAGHRLRLAITTGDTPHMTAPLPSLAAAAGGTIEVLRGQAHPSRLLVPVQAPPPPCTTKRRFAITLRAGKAFRAARSAVVAIGASPKRRVAVRTTRGKVRLTADLSGWPVGPVPVRVAIRGTGRRTLRATRTFHLCPKITVMAGAGSRSASR